MSDKETPAEAQTTKLSQLTQQTLELAAAELAELKGMRDAAAELGKPLNQRAARGHRKRVLDVMRALPALMKESRQLTKDADAWAEGLGYDEKRKLMVDFFRLMPVEHQRALVQELTRVLNERRSA